MPSGIQVTLPETHLMMCPITRALWQHSGRGRTDPGLSGRTYPAPPLKSPPVARDGRQVTVSPLGGRGLQGYFKAPQQWPTHVHQVCVSGAIHGHREKTSCV